MVEPSPPSSSSSSNANSFDAMAVAVASSSVAVAVSLEGGCARGGSGGGAGAEGGGGRGRSAYGGGYPCPVDGGGEDGMAAPAVVVERGVTAGPKVFVADEAQGGRGRTLLSNGGGRGRVGWARSDVAEDCMVGVVEAAAPKA